MTPYSEFGEDKWIESNLTLPANGVYVDLGCMLPDQYSNTAFLRDRGWRGIAIDAADYQSAWAGVSSATFAQALLAGTERTATLAGSGPVARLMEVGDGLTTTIDVLLGRFALDRVDFLSVDLEGMEFDTMSAFPFDRFRPQIIVAEYATREEDGSVKHDFRLREMLESIGYVAAHKTEANIVYDAR